MKSCLLATRQSPLALAQARLVAARFQDQLGVECSFRKFVTTGDRRLEWSLEKQGGKGLFTRELEESLLAGECDAAVHSTKDVPGEMPPGLAIAGYLPRADPWDVLVTRSGADQPVRLATSSPRRRRQLRDLFPDAIFTELRGNVETRLRKVAAGEADATVLAAAGLARLGITAWPGLAFRSLTAAEMVPAVGQGAIAVQCRTGDVAGFSAALDVRTARHIALERALQAALGAGCQTAFGAWAEERCLHLYHERVGRHRLELSVEALDFPARTAVAFLRGLQLL